MTPSTAPLDYPLPYFFSLSLPLCRTLGGPKGGYLLIDDVLIPRYRSGQLGLKRLRSPKDGAYPYGFSLVVLAWIDAKGRRRVPLAFLPYFADGEESKLDLALSLLEWAREEGFEPKGAVRRLVCGKESAGVAPCSKLVFRDETQG